MGWGGGFYLLTVLNWAACKWRRKVCGRMHTCRRWSDTDAAMNCCTHCCTAVMVLLYRDGGRVTSRWDVMHQNGEAGGWEAPVRQTTPLPSGPSVGLVGMYARERDVSPLSAVNQHTIPSLFLHPSPPLLRWTDRIGWDTVSYSLRLRQGELLVVHTLGRGM